jgi:hypothetical protein
MKVDKYVVKEHRTKRAVNKKTKELVSTKKAVPSTSKKGKTSNTNSSFSDRRKALKAYVTKLKQDSKCVICGESDIACLDFHHIGSKHDNVSDLVRRAVSIKVLQKEIDECIIVCANCHRKIHFYGESKLNNNNNRR